MTRNDPYQTRARELAVAAGLDPDARVGEGRGAPVWCNFRDAARAEQVAREASAGRRHLCRRPPGICSARWWRDCIRTTDQQGATPAFPGQRGFVGGSMGDDAVIVEGVDGAQSVGALNSTIHGAGRLFGRTEAKRRFKRAEMDAWLTERGVTLRGADLDESPMAYRRLPEVLTHHGASLKWCTHCARLRSPWQVMVKWIHSRISDAALTGFENSGWAAIIPAMTTPDITEEGSISSTVADGIGVLTFRHPKGNSLPAKLLAGLATEVQALSANGDVRVITLQSDGTGPFCAGASFDELTRVADADAGQTFFSGFGRVILAMIRSPKFIITGVQGRAAGGAVGLIAASDYSVAVRTASAKLSELAVGLGPFVVGPVIEKKIGLAAFSGMAVDADWRDAEWCERHGLYTQLSDSAEAMRASVTKLATTLAASNPEAMAELKRVFWEGTEAWDTVLSARARISGTMVLSEFTSKAIGAFRAR